MTISTLDKLGEACTVAAFLLLCVCCWSLCHDGLNDWWWWMLGWMNMDSLLKFYDSDDLHF